MDARSAMWLQNPFDWDGGWHVLVIGGPRPDPGERVVVTRRDGSESAEMVVAVVAELQRYEPPAVWWLCTVTTNRHNYTGMGKDPEPPRRSWLARLLFG